MTTTWTGTKVYELTWREQRPWDDTEAAPRTVRIVAVRDDKGRLDDLTVEELGKDALGAVQWERIEGCYLPGRVLAELLKEAGHLPAEEDLTWL